MAVSQKPSMISFDLKHTNGACVPDAFRATLPQKEKTLMVPVCVPMRSVQPFRKSVKQQCVRMNSNCVPYAFLIVFKGFLKKCMRSYTFRATVTQFVNITHILFKNVSFSLRGVLSHAILRSRATAKPC